MRLAMRLPPKKGDGGSINAVDPRDGESAEVIDLASRSGFSAVAERKGKTEGLGLAAGVAFVGLLGATTFWAMNAAQQTNEPASVGSPTNAPAQAAAAPAVVPAKVAPAAPAQTAPKRPDPAPAPILARAPNAATGVAANPYSSPALIADFSRASGSSTALQGSAPAGTGAAAAAPATGGAVGSAAAFASAIGGVGGGPARAEAMENPKTTLTKGTLIPAILETAINTDVPGYVRAVVSQDVRSFDGTTVLVPRSSKLIGQYQAGVQNGQKRAYVVWTDLIRPDGVTVKIASPAVSFDGTTGLEGDVDNKFFKRFGSAMLLSMIGGLSAIGTGGASVVLGGAGQGAASVAAQSDSQVGPTIRVPMGQPIRVFVSRQLDFSSVEN